MISKKQDKDEQFSDSLQTVWSEHNIKGKEQLHAIRMEKGTAYITDENIQLLFLILSFPPLGSTNTNKYCFQINKQT